MLRNLQILQTYRLTDLYDFRSPGAHPRTRTVYNTKRCGEAGALRCRRAAALRCGEVARRERCIYSFPRAHARGVAGAAGPVRLVAAARACCEARPVASVVQECRQLVGAGRACGVVGRRGHAHARMQKVELTSEQKVLIFGPIPAVRLGSVRPGGGAGVRGRRLTAVQNR